MGNLERKNTPLGAIQNKEEPRKYPQIKEAQRIAPLFTDKFWPEPLSN
jgi:hypothetical protein